MEKQFQDLDTAPTLTLDPFGQEKVPAEEAGETPVFDESILSEEEKQTVAAFAEKIDLTDSSMVMQYGAGTQKKMADFSESALENVRTKDMGEIGALLSDVVSELKGFGGEEEEKGLFGFFRKSSSKIASLKAKYAKVETNIDQICKALESHQV